MASDEEDFDDLEALRQAALASLASVKPRPNTELPQQEISPSSRKADDDEDLSALREAALRSTKVHPDPVTRGGLAVEQDSRPIPQHHRRRHPKHQPHQRHPYEATRRNGDWMKYHYSRNRANNRIFVPLARQGRTVQKGEFKLHKSQESGNNLELSDNKSLLLPQHKWAGVQPSASENISDGNPKRRKDGKFSRYDDSESDEDSGSDSDMLSLSSESQLNKDMCSDSELSVSNQTDTRIVKRDETKEIVIQKAVSDHLELEATGDSLEIQDKLSDSLLEDFDEPLLDIQENGEIDVSINATMNTSDKQMIDEAFSVDLMPSESLDLEESEPLGKEVFEARKKKFETTEEIKGPDLKKTISLKGIVPKSRKRHRQHRHHRHHRENKLSHSSHKEELQSQDLKERNCDKVEDLRMKTSRSKVYQQHQNRNSSGSSRSSDDGCPGGSFSDGAGQPMRLKGSDMSPGQQVQLKGAELNKVEDLRMKTSRAKDFQRHQNRYSSGSPRSSDDGCRGGSFSDSTGQPIRLRGTDIGGQPICVKRTDIGGQPLRVKRTDIGGQSIRLKRTDRSKVEDLRMKTSRAKDFQQQQNRYSSGSPRSSDDGCPGGSFSDGAGQPIRLKGTDIGTSSRFSQPMSQYRENQRRVVKERSPQRNPSRDARFPLLDPIDSGEDNENSLLKKRSLSSVVRTSPKPKRHKSRKVLDPDQDGNFPKEHYSSNSKAKQCSQPRGWAAMIESRSKTRLTSKEDPDYHGNCDNLELEEQIEKGPQINFTFGYDEAYPAKKVDDRLSVHQRLGLTSSSKTKLEIPEKSTEEPKEKVRKEKKKKTSSGPSKETELDQKILRIQEMNAAILKRQAEVKKDKERYG